MQQGLGHVARSMVTGTLHAAGFRERCRQQDLGNRKQGLGNVAGSRVEGTQLAVGFKESKRQQVLVGSRV